MEHFYKNIGEDWFSYAEYYKNLIRELPQGAVAVEVGCWKGRSTAFFGVELINNRHDITFFCVDSWQYRPNTEQPASSQADFDAVYHEFCRNMNPLGRAINILRMDSIEASKIFPNEYISSLFLDASHYYEDLKNECTAWLPKVKKGGIIAGHDYFTRVHPGVKKAVDEIFGDKIELLPEQNVWIFRK